MGKKSREHRANVISGAEKPYGKTTEDKEQEKEAVNSGILIGLKQQWKKVVVVQYQKEPEKVKNSNIEKNTDDICNNFQVKMVMRMRGIKREDIKRILTEIQSEVISGG